MLQVDKKDCRKCPYCGYVHGVNDGASLMDEEKIIFWCASCVRPYFFYTKKCFVVGCKKRCKTMIDRLGACEEHEDLLQSEVGR